MCKLTSCSLANVFLLGPLSSHSHFTLQTLASFSSNLHNVTTNCFVVHQRGRYL